MVGPNFERTKTLVQTVDVPIIAAGGVRELSDVKKLAEIGVEDAGDITVNLWYNRGNEDILDAVAEQWETNLGINVNVAIMEWAAYLDTLDECNN